MNALAAIAAARYSGVSWEGIEKGLDTFFGAIRRFEKIAEVKGVTIVDDYAHHPKEIECTLKAAKGLDFNRVWAVFPAFHLFKNKDTHERFCESTFYCRYCRCNGYHGKP